MSQRTLYMAWQAEGPSRAWFPVGRLDIEPEMHRFRYIRGAEKAREQSGFWGLGEFPELYRSYSSRQLFATFQNRVINPRRPDRELYLKRLALPTDADPFEIMAVSGGKRVTDSYEVFPKLVKAQDGSFKCRFFLHGWQHTCLAAQDRLRQLNPGEELYVALELTNPRTTVAVQLQSTDYQVLGWAPRYLVEDLSKAMIEVPKYRAQIAQVNALASDGDWGVQAQNYSHYVPTPPAWRVLVEMRGSWTKHVPMSGEDFQPLVD
ncbi:MAG: hypothetical protein OXN89_03590 [Bryobacterales bacterium]|nr:hypothetical protein [Bryobacterales bacterium]